MKKNTILLSNQKYIPFQYNEYPHAHIPNNRTNLVLSDYPKKHHLTHPVHTLPHNMLTICLQRFSTFKLVIWYSFSYRFVVFSSQSSATSVMIMIYEDNLGRGQLKCGIISNHMIPFQHIVRKSVYGLSISS